MSSLQPSGRTAGGGRKGVRATARIARVVATVAVLGWISGVELGCRRTEDRARPAASSAVRVTPEVVRTAAQFEALARGEVAAAASGSPAFQGESLERAAEHYVRAFRLEGKPEHAASAALAFRQAAELLTEAPGTCLLRMRAIGIEAEASLDLAAASRALFELSRTMPACEGEARRLATVLPASDATETGNAATWAGDLSASAERIEAAPEPGEPEITGAMLLAEGAEGYRLVVELSGPAAYRVDTEGEQATVTIRARPAPKMKIPLARGLLRAATVSPAPGGTSLVLDHPGNVTARAFDMTGPSRIVVDVRNLSLQKREMRRIVLDPGHGGIDGGARGASGVDEKDIALDVALRVAPILSRELGAQVLLTRGADDAPPLDVRIAKAAGFGADLFVSIHVNASPDPRAQGISTYVFGADDPRSAESRLRENGAMLDPPVSLSAALESRAAARMHVADLIQRGVMGSVRARHPDVVDGGIRFGRFYVLTGLDCPAVLIETGFITSPREEPRLLDETYRQRLAGGIANGVRAYMEGH